MNFKKYTNINYKAKTTMKEELYLIFTASVNSLCGAHSLVLYKRHWCWLQWLWGKQSYLRNNANHLGNRPPSPHIFFTHASRITNAHGGTLVRQQGQPRRCGSWLLTNSDEMVAPWRNWNCAKKTCPMPWRTTSRDFDPRWQQCIHSNELVDAAQIAKKKNWSGWRCSSCERRHTELGWSRWLPCTLYRVHY